MLDIIYSLVYIRGKCGLHWWSDVPYGRFVFIGTNLHRDIRVYNAALSRIVRFSGSEGRSNSQHDQQTSMWTPPLDQFNALSRVSQGRQRVVLIINKLKSTADGLRYVSPYARSRKSCSQNAVDLVLVNPNRRTAFIYEFQDVTASKGWGHFVSVGRRRVRL